MTRVLIPLPAHGFDPTEAAVPWKVLSERGHEVVFATPDGKPASADPIMVTGKGLGLLKSALRADANGRVAYAEMLASRPTIENVVNTVGAAAVLDMEQHAAGDAAADSHRWLAEEDRHEGCLVPGQCRKLPVQQFAPVEQSA